MIEYGDFHIAFIHISLLIFEDHLSVIEQGILFVNEVLSTFLGSILASPKGWQETVAGIQLGSILLQLGPCVDQQQRGNNKTAHNSI